MEKTLDETITDTIKNAEDCMGLSVFGVRADDDNACIIGSTLDNSYHTTDDCDPIELGGACALTINYDGWDVEDITNDLTELDQYMTEGRKRVLVGGTGWDTGYDKNEIIIHNPVVLYVF